MDRKHPYYLNARFLLLVWAQVLVALGAWLRNVLRDRFVLRLKAPSDEVRLPLFFETTRSGGASRTVSTSKKITPLHSPTSSPRHPPFPPSPLPRHPSRRHPSPR